MRRFRPMVSRRSPSGTHFAELFLAPGPEVIGQTGDNSYGAMFGRNWVLEWNRDDGHLHLWQEQPGGLWLEVVEDLPPVFAAPAPAGSRRWSLAFDQSARVILAYEDADGIVRVTRWDASANQYVQNVSFPGVDPCLTIDASWAHDVPNSDVLLFTLSPDRTQVLCRVQRDVYAVEHLIWDYEQPVILDRVVAAPLRYQVLLSDSTGAPLPHALVSDPYPYLAWDRLAAASAVTGTGALEVVVLEPVLPLELLAGAVSVTGSGALGDPVLTPIGADDLAASASVTGSGAYQPAIVVVSLVDSLAASASVTGSGALANVVIPVPAPVEHIEGVVSVSGGGTYGPS